MGKVNIKKKGKSVTRKKKKRRSSNSTDRSCSSSSSSSSSSSTSSVSVSSIDEETKRKLLKKVKRLRKKEKLKKKKKDKKALKKLMKSKLKKKISDHGKKNETLSVSCGVDINLMNKSKNLAPMTKEEWEKQQNTLKRVFDEETGRMRLVKGTGEIVEECVSRERHLAINKQATKGDGEFFQRKLFQHMK